jgi:murein DD-endopeptidase MepM/ murein hydrolase activator NlpD
MPKPFIEQDRSETVMNCAFASRRAVLRGTIATALSTRFRLASAQTIAGAYSLPIGLPGRVLGDGFLIRHGFACENTWYNPGWWHTGEDWYRLEGDTAGAGVYAVADGEVVFAGSEYPGRVVIVRHAMVLYSVYGHLDHVLAVGEGDPVTRGQLLGTVLDRTDGVAPSHLHFEMRTFLTTPEVNGNTPRYDYGCGFECPPGPGYWPIDAPEHPSAMGWLNPTHVIAKQAGAGSQPGDAEVVVASGAPGSTTLWSLPADRTEAQQLGEFSLTVGERHKWLSIAAGPEVSERTSAEIYRLWYRIDVPDGPAWVQAAMPSSRDTGSDGRPSSIKFTFLSNTTAS